MATKAEWERIRDEIEKAPELGALYYATAQGLYCAVGWLCRDVPEVRRLDSLRMSSGGLFDLDGIGARLRALGLTEVDVFELQEVNDRADELDVKARVLAYVDVKIAEVRDGDAG